ncbi:MAG: phage portal protein, partial [PVC group bacterium]|nr:phage portal protein [PVC group bacterium]
MALLDFRRPEKRSVQTLDDFPPSIVELIRSKSGLTSVNNQTALQLSTYYSCVDVISKVKAGLPASVYKKIKVGEFSASVKMTDHKVSKLLKVRPNVEMSPFVMTRTGTTQAINGGNSFRYIDRSLAGIKNIWLLDPLQIELKRYKPTQRNARGRLYFYDTKTERKYKPEDILHLMGFSSNGLWGDSMVMDHAKKSISLGIEMASFQNNFFENGLNPGGVFEHPQSLGENKNSFLSAVKKRFGGNTKSKGPMTLEDGMTFKPYDVKMVDQQFIELLKMNQIDICGMMGVPLSMISVSDSNTNYNNTESENIRFMKTGLAPWVIPDEQEMSYKLLTEAERDDGLYIKYNFDGFLRGDAETQAKLSKMWFDMGVPVNRSL